jgi:hypothetical protein
MQQYKDAYQLSEAQFTNFQNKIKNPDVSIEGKQIGEYGPKMLS